MFAESAVGAKSRLHSNSPVFKLVNLRLNSFLMPDKNEKARRKSIQRTAREDARQKVRDTLPVPAPVLKALFEYVDQQLKSTECDHTHRHGFVLAPNLCFPLAKGAVKHFLHFGRERHPSVSRFCSLALCLLDFCNHPQSQSSSVIANTFRSAARAPCFVNCASNSARTRSL